MLAWGKSLVDYASRWQENRTDGTAIFRMKSILYASLPNSLETRSRMVLRVVRTRKRKRKKSMITVSSASRSHVHEDDAADMGRTTGGGGGRQARGYWCCAQPSFLHAFVTGRPALHHPTQHVQHPASQHPRNTQAPRPLNVSLGRKIRRTPHPKRPDAFGRVEILYLDHHSRHPSLQLHHHQPWQGIVKRFPCLPYMAAPPLLAPHA